MKTRYVIASVVVFVVLLFVTAKPLKNAIARTIITDDNVPFCNHLVIENWTGDQMFFDGATNIAEWWEPTDIATIIFDEAFRDTIRRQEILEAAWDGGIDTARLKLIPVPLREPKTLNIAAAVLDSVHAWGWKDVTIVTTNLHSARSRKSYLLEAKRFGTSVHVLGIPYSNISSDNWFKSMNGLLTAVEELGKRLYYEVLVF